MQQSTPLHQRTQKMPVCLLSPAKTLADTSKLVVKMTQPPLIGQMERLLPVCQALSKGKLKSLMGLSDSLASLNHTRYSAFSDQESGPAGWMFDGPAHRAFNIASLSSSAQDRAQTVVLTLSGLYGVLRTTDEMRPYRLEMGSKLPTERGSNLYDYWGEHVSACIVDLLRTQPKEEQFIVNCASQEYYKVVNLEALDGIPVYTIKYLFIGIMHV